jgi:hypothetical protein
MRWLFLVHQVQTPNSRERVRVWRLTKKVGAILYRNSVYVLPYSKERLEDFHWLCQQIRDSKGEASVFVSEARDPAEDRALKQLFIRAIEKEYGELGEQLRRFEGLYGQVQETPSINVTQAKSLEKGLRQLEEAFQDIRRADFFQHASAPPIEKTLKQLRLSMAETQMQKGTSHPIAHHSPSEFRGKTWATRAHIHIDRLCSAWLIKRFIDPKAKFVFAPEEKLPQSVVLFDVFGAEFSHQGDRCTFETLLEVFRIKDKALQSLAELVHEIDLKDEKYKRPESPGLDMVVRSLSDELRNDAKTLELGSRLLDALYKWFSLRERP